MTSLASCEEAENANWNFCLELPDPDVEFNHNTVKNSQFLQPLFEFSGACAGCGETYIKLVTQLYGDRMMIANATGCSSIYGGSAPTVPYSVNKKGFGPAWANSLFEDNAEFGFGMNLATTQRRAKLADAVSALYEKAEREDIKAALKAWLDNRDDAEGSRKAADQLLPCWRAAAVTARSARTSWK